MLSMLTDIFVDINTFIKSWSTVTFTLIVIVMVLLLGLAARSFIKKAVSDKPAIKIGKILVIAILVALLIYIVTAYA